MAETSEKNPDIEESIDTQSNEQTTASPEPSVTEQSPSQEYQDLQAKYQRLMAEFDTFRRRAARENLELIEQANGKLLGRLSEVIENFDRATAVETPAGADEYAKGFVMIRDQFTSILKDFGLEILDPAGQPFDPNQHDALMQQPSADVPQDHVVTVYQKGYAVKGKVIRHAKVIVSSGQP